MDKILQTLLSSGWGKNFIMWVFSLMVLGISSLSWAVVHQANELKELNAVLYEQERRAAEDRERLIREHIEYIQQTNQRVDALFKRFKK